jgi:hypothetical protein
MQLRTPSSTARADTASTRARVEAAIRAQNAQASGNPCSGMRQAGEHGADQAFGPDPPGPLSPFRGLNATTGDVSNYGRSAM